MKSTFIKVIIQVSLCEILEYHIFFINKRVNLFADIILSNIVEVFMHFWTELRGVKRVTVRGDITVFRWTFKFDNFYINYQIEANQVKFSPFSRLELRTPSVYRSIPSNVHFGTVNVTVMFVFTRWVKLHKPFSCYFLSWRHNCWMRNWIWTP